MAEVMLTAPTAYRWPQPTARAGGATIDLTASTAERRKAFGAIHHVALQYTTFGHAHSVSMP
jgi:hypothetical protein